MLVVIEDWQVDAPEAQSSVNDTAGPTRYLPVLLGILQVLSVIPVCCVPTVNRVPCQVSPVIGLVWSLPFPIRDKARYVPPSFGDESLDG